MRIAPPLIAVACTVLLAGCSSVLGPKPIPEWAMHSQAVPNARAGGQYARQITSTKSRYRLAQDLDKKKRRIWMSQAIVTKSVRATNGGTESDQQLKPFTKEWYAREEAIEAQLREGIRICGMC